MTSGVVWFTGLPASGKTTLAHRVAELLGSPPPIVLDSDEVRGAIGATGYAEADRDGFYRSLARLAALLAAQGFVVLVAATAPRRQHRAYARSLVPDFLEVWVKTDLAECEARDPKSLYAAARAGVAPSLPGLGAMYEAPDAAELTASGGFDALAAAAIAERVRS